METTKAYYSIKEFAKLLGVHHNTVRRSIKCGRLSAFKIGSGKKAIYRIPHSEIDRIALFDMKEMVEKIIQERSKTG